MPSKLSYFYAVFEHFAKKQSVKETVVFILTVHKKSAIISNMLEIGYSL